MLSGVGSLCLTTKDFDTANFIFPGKFVNFSFTQDSTSKEAQGWVNGQLQTLSSAIASVTNTLTLELDYIDWSGLGWAFDEVPSVSSTQLVPYTKSAVADASGSIADAQVTATSTVLAYAASRGTWGEAGIIPNTSVTVGSGTIDLGATYAGCPVTYHSERSFASIETIGVNNNPQKYGKLAFSGVAYGNEFPDGVTIVLPDITRKSSPSLETSDVPRLTVEYSANVPAGLPSAIQFYNLATAA